MSKKRKVSFVDAKNVRFNLEAEITHRNGYPEFTMSGDYGGGSGQVLDHIVPKNDEQKQLIDIWKKWHLNEQRRALPENFWDDVMALCDRIEELEEQGRSSDKVVDISKSEDSELVEKIVQAAVDENAMALAFYLDLTVDELEGISKETDGYGDCLYECQGAEYYCGTEEEINEAASDYIKDTLWAFRANFLAQMTDIPAVVFEKLQELSENDQNAIQALIEKTCGIEKFCKAAIKKDGIGSFLNGWDGTSDTIDFNGRQYTICRQS